LDLRTGEVLLIPADHFGDDDDWPSEEQIEHDYDAGHLLSIEPLGSDIEYGWMVEFVSSVTDRRLRDRLDAALAGRRPFRRFKDTLHDDTRAREQWFAFRDARLRGAAEAWLVEHEIEASTGAPPPR